MNPSTLQTICQIALAIGIIITSLAGYGSYHFGKAIETNERLEINGLLKKYSQKIKEV